MVFYGKEVENKVRWGISWCVSKVDKHVDDSIILKVNNEDLQFEEQYPINEFKSISGELKIVGLSPNNDTHIFEIIKLNVK